MTKKRTTSTIATVRAEFGSDWQKKTHFKALELMLGSWKVFMESKHKSNSAEIELVEEETTTYGTEGEKEKTSKAYGGCEKCYGKGYSTEARGNVIARADFIGDKEVVLEKARVIMNYCKCDRGKQLSELVEMELAFQKKKVLKTLKSQRGVGQLIGEKADDYISRPKALETIEKI